MAKSVDAAISTFRVAVISQLPVYFSSFTQLRASCPQCFSSSPFLSILRGFICSLEDGSRSFSFVSWTPCTFSFLLPEAPSAGLISWTFTQTVPPGMFFPSSLQSCLLLFWTVEWPPLTPRWRSTVPFIFHHGLCLFHSKNEPQLVIVYSFIVIYSKYTILFTVNIRQCINKLKISLEKRLE